jgi:hypothetical protein
LGFKLIFSNLKFIESAGIVHGYMNKFYFTIRSNPPLLLYLDYNIDNLSSTILIADAKKNRIFYTDDNWLYIQVINELVIP